MKRALILLLPLATACSEPKPPVVARTAPPAKLCTAESAETYAVLPLKNKTSTKIVTDGTEDLLLTQLSGTGCFKLVERDRVDVLISEMKLCDAENANRDYFDCASFAQKGKLLGAARFVLGDVLFAEDNVKGAEIKAKVPGIIDLDLGRTYSGLVVALRIVDTATGQVVASRTTHALIPSDKGELGVRSTSGVELKLFARDTTPMATAYQTMLHDGVAQLHQSLK